MPRVPSCLGEQFPEEVLGRWTFQVLRADEEGDPDSSSRVRVTIKDPTKKLLYSEVLGYDEANYAMTARVGGLHKCCVENHHDINQRVTLAVEMGFSVHDYGDVVGEHLKCASSPTPWLRFAQTCGPDRPILNQLDDSMRMISEISKEMDNALEREEEECAWTPPQRCFPIGDVELFFRRRSTEERNENRTELLGDFDLQTPLVPALPPSCCI